MKAVVFAEHGGPEVVRYDDVAPPCAGPGMVLMKVGATTLNRGLDLTVVEGSFGVAPSLPHVGGSDAAGEVVALGERVEGVAVGDRMLVYSVLFCAICDLCRSGRGENYCRRLRVFGVHCWGGHAQFVAVPTQNLLPIPPNVTYEAAATLPVAYVTAWHGLVTRAGVGPEDTVLVTAAGSGIGAAAIQISKLRGARVLAVSGAPWKRERARDIGADAVIDSTDPGWPEQVHQFSEGLGVTVLFDNLGGADLERSLGCLGRGGRLVCSGATSGHEVALDLRRLYRDQITFLFNAQGSKSELAELVALVGRGEIEPVIDSRFPLRAAAAAHERLHARRQFGKVVLVPEHDVG